MSNNWYALQVAPSVAREAALFASQPFAIRGALKLTPGARLVQELELCDAVVSVPTMREGEREVPLLPGYVLAQPDEANPLSELGVAGVVRVLQGAISQAEVDELLTAAELARSEAFDISNFAIGDQIEVTRGPLAGRTGVLIRCPRRKREAWFITIEFAGSRMAAEVSAEDAKRLAQAAASKRKGAAA